LQALLLAEVFITDMVGKPGVQFAKISSLDHSSRTLTS
jgi:hypothetical protein